MRTDRKLPPPLPREPAAEPTISLEALLLQDLSAWKAAKEAVRKAHRASSRTLREISRGDDRLL